MAKAATYPATTTRVHPGRLNPLLSFSAEVATTSEAIAPASSSQASIDDLPESGTGVLIYPVACRRGATLVAPAGRFGVPLAQRSNACSTDLYAQRSLFRLPQGRRGEAARRARAGAAVASRPGRSRRCRRPRVRSGTACAPALGRAACGPGRWRHVPRGAGPYRDRPGAGGGGSPLSLGGEPVPRVRDRLRPLRGPARPPPPRARPDAGVRHPRGGEDRRRRPAAAGARRAAVAGGGGGGGDHR